MTYQHAIYYAPRVGQPNSNAVFPVAAFDYGASQKVVLAGGGLGSLQLPVGCNLCRIRLVAATADVQYRADGSAVFTGNGLPALVLAHLPIEDVVVTDPARVINFLGTDDDEVVVTPYVVLSTDEVDTTAPAVVENVAAADQSATEIDVTWDATTDDGVIASYLVYRDDVLIATVHRSLLTFSDTELTPETEYTYVVTAVDVAGNESAAGTPAVESTPAA